MTTNLAGTDTQKQYSIIFFKSVLGDYESLLTLLYFHFLWQEIKRRKEQKVLPPRVARTGIEPATQGFSVFLYRFPPILLMALNHLNLPRVYREN